MVHTQHRQAVLEAEAFITTYTLKVCLPKRQEQHWNSSTWPLEQEHGGPGGGNRPQRKLFHRRSVKERLHIVPTHYSTVSALLL
jgi:hypothetical protein